MNDKIQNQIFNTLLRTFPLPKNLENFSIRNKTILYKCLTSNFHPHLIIKYCEQIQDELYKNVEDKIMFEMCYKNVCDLLFEYAIEYYSTLDKIIYSGEFGVMLKVMEHTVFDSKYQNILRNIYLNFIKSVLVYSQGGGFVINPILQLKDLFDKHMDGYYHPDKLKLYKLESLLESIYSSTKEKISKQFEIWQHKIEEKYFILTENNSFMIIVEE